MYSGCHVAEREVMVNFGRYETFYREAVFQSMVYQIQMLNHVLK